MARGGVFLAVLGLAICQVFPAIAQQTSSRTTTAIVECSGAANKDLCILRVLGPLGSSWSTDPDVANAPALLRALEGKASPPPPESALDRAELLPNFAMENAVRHAIEADQRGVQPDQALRELDNVAQGLPTQSFLGGQIVTPNGAGYRIQGYDRIFGLSQTPDANGRNGLPRPSHALAHASLDHWAAIANQVTGDRFAVPSMFDLALAYEELGDRAGVDRAIAIDPSVASLFLLRRALADRNMDSIARLAATQERASSGPANSYMQQAKLQAVDALIANGRRDDALRIVGAARGFPTNFSQLAVMRVAAALPRAEAVAYLAQFENRAMGSRAPEAASAAILAVAGWVSIGERERAERLLAIWRARADAQRNTSCGGDGPDFCVQSYVAQMLRRLDRLNEAAPYADLSVIFQFDYEDGHGVSRVEERIRGRRDWEADSALRECVRLRAFAEHWSEAQTCLDILVRTAGHRHLTDQQVQMNAGFVVTAGGPYVAAFAAFDLAGAAARSGRANIADAALASGVELLRQVPAAAIDNTAAVGLRNYALNRLSAIGQL